MKNWIVCLVILPFAHLGFSQSQIEAPIADQFDVVTADWIKKSTRLKTYEGVSSYCRTPQFRKSVDRLLNEIHQYDSLILNKMEDPAAYLSWNRKEEKKTLSDIGAFEKKYGTRAFVDHMRDACQFRKELEKNREKLKNGLGAESYDAQVLLLEAEQSRYFKKIDKLIVKIDEHLHVLNIEN